MEAELKQAKLRPLANGKFQALSSDGHTRYLVTIGERLSCTCPAGAQGRACYHVRNAGERYAAFWPKPRRRAHVSDLYN